MSMIQMADCGIGIEGKVRVPFGHRVVRVLPAGPEPHSRVTGRPAAPSDPQEVQVGSGGHQRQTPHVPTSSLFLGRPETSAPLSPPCRAQPRCRQPSCKPLLPSWRWQHLTQFVRPCPHPAVSCGCGLSCEVSPIPVSPSATVPPGALRCGVAALTAVPSPASRSPCGQRLFAGPQGSLGGRYHVQLSASGLSYQGGPAVLQSCLRLPDTPCQPVPSGAVGTAPSFGRWRLSSTGPFWGRLLLVRRVSGRRCARCRRAGRPPWPRTSPSRSSSTSAGCSWCTGAAATNARPRSASSSCTGASSSPPCRCAGSVLRRAGPRATECGSDRCSPLPKAVFSSVFYFASVPLYQGFLMVG